MPLHPTWTDLSIRLALTVVAGLAVGANRGERGHPAGLRTILLVCLAASVSMIQVNLFLAQAGKPPNGFVNLDAMRLPLGILTGVGFIGAGAIFRKGNLVQGVTTAATLWFVTVIGLCFGAGQVTLGITCTALALIALWGLKWVEQELPQRQRATLTLTLDSMGPAESDLRQILADSKCKIIRSAVYFENSPRAGRKLRFDLAWTTRRSLAHRPSFVDDLTTRPGVRKILWIPE